MILSFNFLFFEFLQDVHLLTPLPILITPIDAKLAQIGEIAFDEVLIREHSHGIAAFRKLDMYSHDIPSEQTNQFLVIVPMQDQLFLAEDILTDYNPQFDLWSQDINQLQRIIELLYIIDPDTQFAQGSEGCSSRQEGKILSRDMRMKFVVVGKRERVHFPGETIEQHEQFSERLLVLKLQFKLPNFLKNRCIVTAIDHKDRLLQNLQWKLDAFADKNPDGLLPAVVVQYLIDAILEFELETALDVYGHQLIEMGSQLFVPGGTAGFDGAPPLHLLQVLQWQEGHQVRNQLVVRRLQLLFEEVLRFVDLLVLSAVGALELRHLLPQCLQLQNLQLQQGYFLLDLDQNLLIGFGLLLELLLVLQIEQYTHERMGVRTAWRAIVTNTVFVLATQHDGRG